MWSSHPKTSRKGGSDLRGGGDTAETLIRLDKLIILPAILYSHQEVYSSLKALDP